MNKRQRNWMIAIISVVAVIAIVLVIASMGSQGSSEAEYQSTTVQRGTLTSTVEGTGTVRSVLSTILTWQTSGQVDQVNANIGDKVKTGDTLATLRRSSQAMTTLESSLVTAQENLAELTSPQAIANAKLAVTKAEEDVINAQTAVNNLQYWQNEGLIQEQYAKLIIAKDKLDRAQEAYDQANVGEYINNAQEAQLYQALYNAQQAYETASYFFSVYSQEPSQRQVDEAQATLDLAQARLIETTNYLAALTGGEIPADATGASLLKLKQARLAVQTAQDNLEAASLEAPFGGTITQSDVVEEAIVSQGTQAYRIDDLSNLVIDVQVVEIDVNQIQTGQSATIIFDAIPNTVYTGKVIKTDLAGTQAQNSISFTVTVQLMDADALVKPGMAASVTIVTNVVEDALLVPSTAIFVDNNNQQFVYLVQGGVLTSVPVTTGAVSDTTTQILDDTLREGDSIVLSFASTSSTGGGGFMMGRVGGGNGPAEEINP